MKKVTVFIPVYNAEKYIRETIDSILTQTYENFELLIIDDGSTDNTVNIINKYNDKRIVLIRNISNKGLPYTRNRGIQEATGEYIALIDADDIAYPNRLEKQVEYLNDNKNVLVVASLSDLIIDNKIKENKIRKRNENLDIENTILEINIMFGNIISNPTVMFRRKEILKLNIRYRLECFVAQDYAFWIDCKKKGQFHVIQEALIAYRTGHQNITKISSDILREERREIIDNLKIRAIKNNGFELSDFNLFNKVFSDPKNDLQMQDFYNIKIILNEIILQNRKNSFYNAKILSETIKYKFVGELAISELNLITKLKLALYKYKEESLFSVIINLVRLIKKR